nr:hypothetical protein [Pseudomonas sp. BIGb0427]
MHTTNPDLTNSITSTTGGNYEKLDTAGNPVTTVTDGPGTDDTTGLKLTATGSVAEGGDIVYTATLTNPAGTEMKVTLSNGEVITIAKRPDRRQHHCSGAGRRRVRRRGRSQRDCHRYYRR